MSRQNPPAPTGWDGGVPARVLYLPAAHAGSRGMIVEQIWTANSGRNFNYLIACGETGEALAIDPLDYEKCLAAAKAKGWTIAQVLNTHHHRDHTAGNDQLYVEMHAKLLVHAHDREHKDVVDRRLTTG